MKRWRHGLRVSGGALALTLAVATHAADAKPCGLVRVGLNTVAADTWFTGERDDPEGPLADLARTVLQPLGCQISLQRMPLARLLIDAEAGVIDLALVVTVTAERRKALRFPETPTGELDTSLALGRSRVSLFALADSVERLNALRDKGDPKALSVVVQRSSVGEELAKAAGWKMEYAPDAERAMAMLRLQRADYLIAPDWALSAKSLKQAPEVRVVEPPLRLQPYYAPVSRAYWERDPRLVEAIWRALCQKAGGMLGGGQTVCVSGAKKGDILRP
jgi:hypothetical protein